MSEELIQKNLVEAPEKMGDWNFYNIGATTLKALKGAKIIPDRDYDEYETKKPDALIVKKPLVIAAIEYKVPAQLRTDKQIEKAIEQELGTAQVLQAKVYIITDGKKSIWVNPANGHEILQEDGSKITLNFDKDSAECIVLINKIRASINATNDTIKAAASVDPLPLAEKVWQDLWAVSGATPENCLYTFVEIFIFKYLSDLGVLKGMYSFYDLLSKYSGNNENEVLEFYASTIRVKIKELFPGNPKDKTTIINGTIFVSKDDKAVSGYATVFHKILKRFNDFGTLENIDYDFKSKLFETFLKESISKKNWGQYFTPLKVVRAIVNMADIEPGMSICDPACGVGKFLLEPILHSLDRLYAVSTDEAGNEKLLPQITLSGFDKGFDKDEQKTIILAKANMLIYMSGMIKEHPGLTKQFAELFNNTFTLQTNSILGTLAKPITEEYDLILTNPPYVMSGSSNLKEEIAKDDALKKYFSISAMGIEGLFMEWIIRALKPGKKAFIVVPDGIMNRSNDKKLRDFILEQCNIDAVIETVSLEDYIGMVADTASTLMEFDEPLRELVKKKSAIVSSVEVSLNDKTLFDLSIGKRLLRKDYIEASGRIPAYSSNVFSPFVYTSYSNVEDFSIPYVLWGIDGTFEFNVMPIGEKFAYTDHCGVIKIKNPKINPYYLAYTLEENKHKYGFDRGLRASLSNMKSVKVSIPVDDSGEFDESAQSGIADSMLGMRQIRESLSEKKAEIKRVKIFIDDENFLFRYIPIEEIFDLVRGNGKYTKSYVQNHKGEYPLYSGNTSGLFATIDSFDFDSPCLSWAIDGLAGFMMIHNESFSATNHRGVLIPHEDKLGLIDLQYMKYTLEPLFRAAKKGREGDNGENEYTTLPPFMIADIMVPVPVDGQGNISLDAQKEIAAKYLAIEQCKNEVISKLDSLIQQKIEL